LTGTALAGAMFGIASAQTPSMPFQPSQGMMVAPSAENAIANSGNNATGGVFHWTQNRAQPKPGDWHGISQHQDRPD
jgi:hypothetical protein